MPQQETAPCFIVIGIVMIVFGGVFLFLGILMAIIENNTKQKAMKKNMIQPQIQPHSPQQAPIIPIQNIKIVEEPPKQHKYCPYCGKETSSEICPDCGKEID